MARVMLAVLLLCSVATAAEWDHPALSKAGFDIALGRAETLKLPESPEIAAALVAHKGFMVTRDTPFSKSLELQIFDIIVAINGYSVHTIEDLAAAVSTITPGADTPFVVSRITANGSGFTFTRVDLKAKTPSRREVILNNIATTEDRVTQQKWVRHATEADATKTRISPYFQIVDGKATNLRVKIIRVDKSLLVPVTILIRSGESLNKFPVQFKELSTDIGLGYTYTSVDWSVTDEMYSSLASIALNGTGILRFENREREVDDVDLTSDAAQRIAEILIAYELHGATSPPDRLKWITARYSERDAKAADGVAKLQKAAEPPKPLGSEAKPTPKMTPEEIAQAKEDAARAREQAQAKAAKAKEQAYEDAAAKKLSLAKPFVNKGDSATARKRLQEIIDQFDGTKAAAEAAILLKKLGK